MNAIKARKRKPALTVKLAARQLDVPLRTMYHLCKTGRVPCVKYLNKILILQETIDEVLASGGLIDRPVPIDRAAPIDRPAWFKPAPPDEEW